MRVSIRANGDLGPLLKRLRKERGWSQTELGKRVGLSQERISVIESKPESVTLDNLLTLMMVLDAHFVVEQNSASPTAQPGQAEW
jgi:HTH-type transcriptional regulator/antitoxin HipB